MAPSAQTQALAREIGIFCQDHADQALAQRNARYFSEGYDAHGIDQKTLLAERGRLLEAHGPELGLTGFLDLGDALVTTGKYEETSLAILLVASYREQIDAATLQRVGRWFEGGIGNWAHSDVLCAEILAPNLREGLAELNDLASWLDSTFKYKRRAVPVAMLGLLKTDAPLGPLLDHIRPLMHDPDRVVQQGVGWFLREVWKKAPEDVETFLLEYKDSAPRLIFQYATEKMAKEDKTRFRRAKS